MTQSPLTLTAKDLAKFTRALARQLGDNAPGHLALMNMLARAAGFQNVQHMRAVGAPAMDGVTGAAPPPQPAAAVDTRKIDRVLQQFDGFGRLVQWPARRHVQTLALWALWAALPAATKLTEREISALIEGEHLFHDAAILRRSLIACNMVTRQAGGVDYLRIEQEPPPEARALIRAIAARRKLRTV